VAFEVPVEVHTFKLFLFVVASNGVSVSAQKPSFLYCFYTKKNQGEGAAPMPVAAESARASGGGRANRGGGGSSGVVERKPINHGGNEDATKNDTK